MASLVKPLALLLSLLLVHSYAAPISPDGNEDAAPVGDLEMEPDLDIGLGLGDYPGDGLRNVNHARNIPKFNIPVWPRREKSPNLETNIPVWPRREKSPNLETNYQGMWTLENPNAGVSAMHMQLLPNNKAIMFDATDLGPSAIKLPPGEQCRPFPNKPAEQDCFAHAVEYDVQTKQVKPLKLVTNAWCSSGGLTVEGNLISTGGYFEGGHAVRVLTQNNNGHYDENAKGLAAPRWYASQEKLGDGSFVIFGGRNEFSMDIIQRDAIRNPPRKIDLPFLKETTDTYENNLYPFAHLLPDGNMFLFANSRSVILDPKTGRVIKELPVLPGGSRNYPASGSSVLLPLNLGLPNPDKTLRPLKVEVLVCGGARTEAAAAAEKKNLMPALQDCGRIAVTDPNPKWEIEMMPTRRVMHDMLVLPTGEVLILNGATNGVSGWNLGEGPVLRPAVYNPEKRAGERFKELQAATIPRMYHSSAVVLQDGRVLVAGSNANSVYNFTAKYPTELRVEKFSPHYTDPRLDLYRPRIVETDYKKEMSYGQKYMFGVKIRDFEAKKEDIKVTMLAPAFPTHGYSQNQRLVVMDADLYVPGTLSFTTPASGNIAPPGHYILYVVHRGVPSTGVWVKIE